MKNSNNILQLENKPTVNDDEISEATKEYARKIQLECARLKRHYTENVEAKKLSHNELRLEAIINVQEQEFGELIEENSLLIKKVQHQAMQTKELQEKLVDAQKQVSAMDEVKDINRSNKEIIVQYKQRIDILERSLSEKISRINHLEEQSRIPPKKLQPEKAVRTSVANSANTVFNKKKIPPLANKTDNNDIPKNDIFPLFKKLSVNESATIKLKQMFEELCATKYNFPNIKSDGDPKSQATKKVIQAKYNFYQKIHPIINSAIALKEHDITNYNSLLERIITKIQLHEEHYEKNQPQIKYSGEISLRRQAASQYAKPSLELDQNLRVQSFKNAIAEYLKLKDLMPEPSFALINLITMEFNLALNINRTSAEEAAQYFKASVQYCDELLAIKAFSCQAFYFKAYNYFQLQDYQKCNENLNLAYDFQKLLNVGYSINDLHTLKEKLIANYPLAKFEANSELKNENKTSFIKL